MILHYIEMIILFSILFFEVICLLCVIFYSIYLEYFV